MNRHMGRTLFRGHVNYRVLLLLIFAVVQLSSCGSGGGDDAPSDVPPEVPPTAVIEVSDGAGAPLVNGRIGYGEDFILSAKRSFADGDVGLLSYRWTALTSSGGGMSQGKEVETANATLRVTASHSAVPLGAQRYQLIVVDNLENVSKPVSLQVVVIDKVPPVAVLDAVDGNGSPLVNGSVQYGQDFVLSGKGSSDTGGGSIVKYHWTAVTAPVGLFAGSGTVITSNSRLTVNASSAGVPAGTQTYRLVVEDDSGNLSAPVEVSVAVVVLNQPPTAVISLSQISGFAPLTVDFDASGSTDSDGSIVSYVWGFGDGNSGSGVNVTHVYQTPGTYGIALTVTDDDGDTGMVDPEPQVQVLPPPVVTITPASATLEPGGTQQFNASVTGASNTGVVWSLSNSSCGSIDSSGMFTAGNPATSCANTVRAVSLADDRVSATASVSIATCSNAVYDVNNTIDLGDANPGDNLCDDGIGNCTLRAAIEEANACLGPNTVNVPAGTYVLSLGQLAISDELTVNGAGATATIIDGNGASRIFSVAGGLAAISLNDLTLANGRVSSSGPAVSLSGNTPMRIQRAILRDNAAQSNGCTIKMHQDASLELIETSLVHNRCEGTGPGGSAIMMDAGDTLVIRSSTIAYNGPSSTGSGAGVIMEWSHGENPISVSIENSTIAGNQGPAIKASNWVTVDIKNSTITNNDEGIKVESGNGGASTVNIGNSILYANATNCAINNGTLTSTGYNIDSRNTCGFTATGDQVNTDPKLGALADNGGPTQTRGLLAGSPALNAGDNGTCLASDQRGNLRDDGSCDIGAYEGEVTLASCLGANLLVTSTLDAVDATVGDGICDDGNGNCTLRAAVQEANACVGYDVIDLPVGIYLLSLNGISENAAATGDLDIVDDLSINGASAVSTVVDAGSDGVVFGDRLFHVLNNVPSSFSGLMLQGVVNSNLPGGGIASSGDLQVNDVVITGNSAKHGTGIYAWISGTTVTVTNSTLNANTGNGSGAGIYVGNSVTLDISDSTLSANTQAYEYGHRGVAIYGGAGATVRLTRTTVDNNASGYAESIYVNNDATLDIRDSQVSNSQTGTRGILTGTGSNVTITRSVVSGNLSGGVSTGAGSVLSIVDSSISDNEAHAVGSFSANGAGAAIGGSFTITGATFSGNRIINDGSGGSGGGAGIYLANTASGTMSNSTLSGNHNGGQSGWGGGIGGNGGALTLLNTTFSGNTAPYGDNFGAQNATLSVANSIFANGDCNMSYTTVVSNGHNIDHGNTCGLTDPTDKVNTDPMLGPLADNGGPTQTHALQPGSPAIDAGDDALCLATDQRGIVRPQDGDANGLAVCDVGAYEVQ